MIITNYIRSMCYHFVCSEIEARFSLNIYVKKIFILRTRVAAWYYEGSVGIWQKRYQKYGNMLKW